MMGVAAAGRRPSSTGRTEHRVTDRRSSSHRPGLACSFVQIVWCPLKQAGCERLYVEKASGAHRDRPELKAALEYMRPGDNLVVWRLSRLARSLKQIIETAHELEQRKQALKVLTRNIDTGTPEGRLFFHITAAFDEFQRELIVENTKAGLAAARKRGRLGGRPRVLDKEKIRFAEAMLKDTVNYPFVRDVIDHLRIGRTAFYRYFPPDRIRELRNHA
ncbi:MAG TPA: recombinase family protein [Acetobacteraceae bacterium]|jgi:DNA invertase Pin-like site-specific DNA recombinase|nr:recombinase family protein [Acetobacteraceae bacterium]